MKQSLLAIALATIALSSTAHAEYVYKLPLEVANGGSLPNGTISFGNGGGATTPVEPTEPEVIDPFEPENPACDPYAAGYPGNSTGKDLIWGVWYDNSYTDGSTYRPCKLKPVEKDKLLARFPFSFPERVDHCNPLNGISGNNGVGSCSIQSQIFQFHYKYSVAGDGTYTYTNLPVAFYVHANAGFNLEDIDRIVFDGEACTNPRYRVGPPPFNKVTNEPICDMSASYNQMKSKANTQFIVEIYGK